MDEPLKQVAAYQTSDGKAFVDEEEARQHEVAIGHGVSQRACQILVDHWRRIAKDTNTSPAEAEKLRCCAQNLLDMLGK